MLPSFLKSAVLAAGVLALAACTNAPDMPAPSLDASRVTLAPPNGGAIQVSGQAGAIRDASVTSVTITVYRAAGRQVLHLSHQDMPIASSYAVAGAAGAFNPVQLGDAESPISSGDEINLTTYAALRQVGPTITLTVP